MLIFILIALLCTKACLGLKCLRTSEEGPVKNEPCVFPFTHSNKVYDSCTSVSDPDGRFWCSTKVNREGVHMIGHWGYCEPDCKEHQDEETKVSISNEVIRCWKTNKDGPVKDKPCIYPFNFKGKSFNTCINLEQEDPSKFWCPTQLDKNRNFQVGEWGYCDVDCKSEPGLDRFDSDILDYVDLSPLSRPRSGDDEDQSETF